MRQATRCVAIILGLLAPACGGSDAPGGDDTPGDDALPPDADAPDAPPPDSTPCGVGGGERGLTRHTVEIDGLERSYLVYLPPEIPSTQPMPLVFVHHGYTMSGQLMADVTQYRELADEEGIALAFPDGQGGANSLGAPWNVGADLCPSYAGAPPVATGDDFALLDSIQATVAVDQCLDREHVFVTGFSMGGYFAHHAACEYPGIAGAAPHSGGTHPLDSCSGGVKPVIMFHGSADPVIPAGCNDPDAIGVPGVTPAAEAWAVHNGCSLDTTEIDVTGGTCHVFEGCPPGGQVELCTFTAMGHCWAGGAASSGIYACPLYADATRLEWEFFKAHAW